MIRKIPTKIAIKKVFKDRAMFMDADTGETFDFDGWIRRGPGTKSIICSNNRVAIPDFIVLKFYNGLGFNSKITDPRFSRYNIYVRDGGCCMFCGKALPYQKGAFTFDHIHPKSRGGAKDWHNIVLSCHECNRKKANKSLEDSGMKLREKPIKPSPEYLRSRSVKIRNAIWRQNDDKLARFI